MVRGVQILAALLGGAGVLLLTLWGAALLGGVDGGVDVRAVGVGLFLGVTAAFIAAIAVVALRRQS